MTATGESMSIEDAVLNGSVFQSEADRLSGLSYSVPADATSDAGEYIIQPSLSPELDVSNPMTELDRAITEKYNLEFNNGSLTIEKLSLTITPMDVEIVYGEVLPPRWSTVSLRNRNCRCNN